MSLKIVKNSENDRNYIDNSTVLELINTSRDYGNLSVFKNLDWRITKGEKIIISGENGVGKTTLLNLARGELNPNDGQVFRNQKLKYSIFYDRDFGLFPHLNGLENINFFCSVLKVGNLDELESFQFLSMSETFQNALKTKFYKCSNGMKKLLLFFISQLNNPDVFLLDEPFTKLDLKNKELIIRFLEKFFKNKTVICVTHEIPEAGLEQYKKLILKDGKLC